MQTVIEPAIAKWQREHHEFGYIRFFPPDNAAEQFPFYKLPETSKFIGLLEADALCLENDGTLVVYDHEVPNRIFCKAAKSQTAFLKALSLIEQHNNKYSESSTCLDREVAEQKVGEECSVMAGGDEYRGLYCILIG